MPTALLQQHTALNVAERKQVALCDRAFDIWKRYFALLTETYTACSKVTLNAKLLSLPLIPHTVSGWNMFLDNKVSSGSPFNIYSACQNEVQYILFYTVDTKHVSL